MTGYEGAWTDYTKHFVKTNLQNTVKFLGELYISMSNVCMHISTSFMNMKFHCDFIYIPLWVSLFISLIGGGFMSLMPWGVLFLSRALLRYLHSHPMYRSHIAADDLAPRQTCHDNKCLFPRVLHLHCSLCGIDNFK